MIISYWSCLSFSPQCLSVGGGLSTCRWCQSSVQPSLPLSSSRLHPLHLPPAPRTLEPTSALLLSLTHDPVTVGADRPPAAPETLKETWRNIDPPSDLVSVPITCQHHCKPRLLLRAHWIVRRITGKKSWIQGCDIRMWNSPAGFPVFRSLEFIFFFCSEFPLFLLAGWIFNQLNFPTVHRSSVDPSQISPCWTVLGQKDRRLLSHSWPPSIPRVKWFTEDSSSASSHDHKEALWNWGHEARIKHLWE